MAKQQQPKPKKVLKLVEPTVGLTPAGSVKQRQLDSIGKANPKLSKVIGNPIKRYPNSQPKFNASASDMVKKAIQPKKLTAAKPKTILAKK